LLLRRPCVGGIRFAIPPLYVPDVRRGYSRIGWQGKR
jgi:hypothetical protein